MCVCMCVRVCVSVCAQPLGGSYLFVTPWVVARQAPQSVGFPRQEYWSGLPFPSPGHLLKPGIEPEPPALAGEFFTTEPPGKPQEEMLKPLILCKLL